MSSLLVDAHCHITTSTEEGKIEFEIPDVPVTRCFMSNNEYDWTRVKAVVNSDQSDRSLAAFGIHPWYSHLFFMGPEAFTGKDHYRNVLHGGDEEEIERIIAQLPEPINLESYIQREFDPKFVACVGEIGLDKVFRLPGNGFYQGDRPSPLGRVRVKMEHQVKIFTAMCDLAVQHELPVSIHCVKCPSLMFDVCKAHLLPHPKVKICLHSFTGSLETLESFWLPTFACDRFFLSISRYFNFKSSEAGLQLLKRVPLQCILTETDFTWDNTSKEQLLQDLSFLVQQVANVHGLDSADAAQDAVYHNFQRFILR